MPYSIKAKLELSGSLPLYESGEIEKLSQIAIKNTGGSIRTEMDKNSRASYRLSGGRQL